MKRWFPWIAAGVFALWTLSGVRPPKEQGAYDANSFGKLPVLLSGRIQPLDSVGMNAMLSMRGKRTVRVGEEGDKIHATQWLMDVMMRPERAAEYPVFRVQHPDVQGLLGRTSDGGLQYYSYSQLDEEKLAEIDRQAQALRESGKKVELYTPREKDLMHLYRSLVVYHQLKNTIRPEGAEDFSAELELYTKTLTSAKAAIEQDESAESMSESDLALLLRFVRRYQMLASFGYAMVVPPTDPKANPDDWKTIGASLTNAPRSGLHPAVEYFAQMSTAYRADKPEEFNRALAAYRGWLESNGFQWHLEKGKSEFFFNQMEPFYHSMVIYVAALVLGCGFWLNWSQTVRKSAFWLLLLALVVHTVGLIYRMVLEGRPPVTNLYSSAIFVGWGAVVLGAILESIFKDGIGTVAAAIVGFTTLIIAHHLSLSGDTMEMLQAVLDTNFWLATHVVVITLGYASMFCAGILAILYIFRGVFTRSLSAQTANSLSRMVYGIICFATLFSFIGTILGGIWADQSWGRFWGWDPKENGALLIVIWCAIILHARWGRMIAQRGLMVLAVFGNIVTSFSWFGVNMLGVGLHSYGFMDQAFKWLVGFCVSQVVIIGIAMIPLKEWKSFKTLGNREPATPPPGVPEASPA